MTTPAYPHGIFSWTQQQDFVDIDDAELPNSLAADLIAVESTLGVMPQRMNNPNAGPATTFSNVSQLLDYLTAGYQIPVAELQSNGQQVPNRQGSGTHYGVYNNYSSVVYDPFGISNGTDITAPITGWYVIDAGQFWDWNNSGYVASHLWIGAGWKTTSRWDWAFQGNSSGGYWEGGGTTGRPGFTGIHWSGIVNHGQRIAVISENGTSATPANVRNLQLSVSLTRITPVDEQFLPAAYNTNTASPVPVISRYPAPSGLMLTNGGSGTITVSWNSITSPTPVPVSYSVAIYNVATEALTSFSTAAAGAPGVQALVVSGLATGGVSYQVHVWANGGLLSPPHSIVSVSL